ncbi:steroid 17-alpha-hydroxylase/17,20 lyase-like [Ptychodera flava]|uniref:steroid 17-alpha-hydroxylase/17,20 lyase-like n=1 Tax=Ptychodera flava TaxID=63121 RepID=UPI00396A8A91
MVSIGSIWSFLSSPTNVTLGLIVLLVICALWSMHIPSGFPPGPRGLPFIGSILSLGEDPIGVFEGLAKTYGDIFSFKMGADRYVLLCNIELVREALVQKQDAFAGRAWTYTGEITSDGGEGILFGNFTPKWQAMRKISCKAIRKYTTTGKLETLIREHVFPRLKKTITEKNGEPFDPQPVLMLTVINIMASVCFGKFYELEDSGFKTCFNYINDSDNFGNGLVADFIPIFRYITTKTVREMTTWKDNLIEFLKSEVDDHEKNVGEENASDFIYEILKTKKEAIAAGENIADVLTDLNVIHSLSDFFGAGIDTTVNILNFCVAYLVNYPDVQVKVQKEIDDVIGQGRSPSLSDKGKLPYCEAVINEVLRIRTVLPLGVPHETLEDTSVGGYNIPKGTKIMTFFWKVHFDERHWKRPEEFRPERFLDNDGKALPKHASLIPFSAGRRVCPGETIAINQLILLFASLFQQFCFFPAPGKEKPPLKPVINNLVIRNAPYEVVAKERNA